MEQPVRAVLLAALVRFVIPHLWSEIIGEETVRDFSSECMCLSLILDEVHEFASPEDMARCVGYPTVTLSAGYFEQP